tara:strand:- start:223 stop:354 length:132 start_codon:yes stop_codon:yes gene_type:complete
VKVTVEFNEDDAQEVVELGQQLLAVVRRLEDLERRLETLLDET